MRTNSINKLELDWRRFCRCVLYKKPKIKYLNPRFMPVLIYRLCEICIELGIPVVGYLFSSINVILFGLEISMKTKIKSGLLLPHPNGVVIGAISIGRNCTIYQQVTLGSASPLDQAKRNKLPVIGNNVLIGAGAKILGDINIENRTLVKANSVICNY